MIVDLPKENLLALGFAAILTAVTLSEASLSDDPKMRELHDKARDGLIYGTVDATELKNLGLLVLGEATK